MLDLFGIPPKYKSNTQIFTPNGAVLTAGFQQWNRPKGITMMFITMVSAGAGGGGGFTRTAGNAGGGGGGGACGGIVRFLVSALLLPETLYIYVPSGGLGGAPGAAGGNVLNRALVSTNPTTILNPNHILFSDNNLPLGGGAGTAGAAGAGGTIPSLGGSSAFQLMGLMTANTGIAGSAGGAHTGADGVGVTCWGTSPLSPGAGGAGCTAGDFSGGGQTPTALCDLGQNGYYPFTTGSIAAGGAIGGAGVNGAAGRFALTPFYNSGGAGGGSNNSGVAGNGGNGGYGCGGGGGGAGATGGSGGRGGDGIIIITCW